MWLESIQGIRVVELTFPDGGLDRFSYWGVMEGPFFQFVINRDYLVSFELVHGSLYDDLRDSIAGNIIHAVLLPRDLLPVMASRLNSRSLRSLVTTSYSCGFRSNIAEATTSKHPHRELIMVVVSDPAVRGQGLNDMVKMDMWYRMLLPSGMETTRAPTPVMLSDKFDCFTNIPGDGKFFMSTTMAKGSSWPQQWQKGSLRVDVEIPPEFVNYMMSDMKKVLAWPAIGLLE